MPGGLARNKGEKQAPDSAASRGTETGPGTCPAWLARKRDGTPGARFGRRIGNGEDPPDASADKADEPPEGSPPAVFVLLCPLVP